MQALDPRLILALWLQDQGAPAEPTQAPPQGSLLNFMFPMILIIGIFYLVLILPERKKQKQRKVMLDAMKKGDKVMTSGGMYGQVAAIQDDVVTLQVDEGVRIRFNRVAVQSVLSPEESKADKKD